MPCAAGNCCAIYASATGVTATNLESGLKLSRHGLVHARCLKHAYVRGIPSGHDDLHTLCLWVKQEWHRISSNTATAMSKGDSYILKTSLEPTDQSCVAWHLNTYAAI